MPKGRRVYIVGFMGSGKTTAGKSLARSLGWKYSDLDNIIEAGEGLTVREIFAKNGEEHFRQIESYYLRSLDSSEDTVISCGGGTPCFHANMEHMLGNGIVLYLKMTPAALASRLVNDRGERPLIKNISPADLPKFIEEKLSAREHWYAKADIIAEGLSPDLRAISEAVRNYLSRSGE